MTERDLAVVLTAPPCSDPFIGRLLALRADSRLAGYVFSRPHPLLIVARDESGNQVQLLPALPWPQAREVLKPVAADDAESRGAVILFGELSAGDLAAALSDGHLATLPSGASDDQVFVALHGAFEFLRCQEGAARRSELLDRYRGESAQLVEMAHALTTERKLERLFAVILEKGRHVTGAEAGSIYVVEGDALELENRTLRFSHSQNDSVSFDSQAFFLPISERSMSGYVALHQQVLNVRDAYDLPGDAPFSFDSTFDEAIGYRTKSMLCSPLFSRTGEVIGVLQLINRKAPAASKLDDGSSQSVLSFDSRSESLLKTFASFAGIALENAMLAAENEQMLAGFVRASVSAIEQRDPTTSGHSIRVATMSLGLAKALARSDTSHSRNLSWSADELLELEYASLLHDFGKIGVREDVLLKAKKLYPYQLELIRSRFALAESSLSVERLRRELELTKALASLEAFQRVQEEFDVGVRELANAFQSICQCDEPMVLPGGSFAAVEELSRRRFRDHSGQEHSLLLPFELAALSVPRGSLTTEEFAEIRSHVEHTYSFLSAIPWGRKLRNVPSIARAHHERLDGTGYPTAISDPEIPLQSKIMAVSDIFDALTASDRPYKKAVPLERALDILGMEVRSGHIDGELVRVFTDAAVWATVGQAKS